MKEIIKKYSLLDVEITSQVDEDTLNLIISDPPVETTTVVGTGAEHFSTQLSGVVYTYNTSNNLAVMDALNEAKVDPSDIIGEEAPSESKSKSESETSNLYENILLIVFIIIIVLLMLTKII